MSESVALISAARIESDALKHFLRARGLVEVLVNRWLLEGPNGRIWIEHATEALPSILTISDGAIESKLAGQPSDAVIIIVGRGSGSDRLAMEFSLEFMERWEAVLDDDNGLFYERDELKVKLSRGEPLWPKEMW